MDILAVDPEIFGALAVFVVQVGARHLVFNFSSIQQKIIAHPISQGMILFGLFYISTRRLYIALGLLLFYYIVVFVLLNEQHPMNIIPRKLLVSEGFIDANELSPIDMYYMNVNKLKDSFTVRT